jgi:single-stranded-DNA-specific exonuclease
LDYLHPEQGELGDPFRLSGMEAAVDRLQLALKGGELVAVYGDYDTDGVTATAALVHAFRELGIKTIWYVPDRFREGYGIHLEALHDLKSKGVSLIVSVDCGIRAWREIEAARQMELDFIVTDHHQPGPELPPAVAVIDPKRTDQPPVFRDFSGVGLAFQLGRAIFLALSRPEPLHLLDLVAIGTVADLAPLVGENRILVARGLQAINRSPRPGIAALMGCSGITAGSCNSGDIGFRIGPRLNAAGRLQHGRLAVEALLTQDESEANLFASKLDELNRERQKITAETVVQAREQDWRVDDPPPLIHARGPEIHEGIMGLVASRLTEEFYRPSIVANTGPQFTRGSARSIAEVSIVAAFESCADLLERFGGHDRAAGFTVRNERYFDFVERLEVHLDQFFQQESPRPTLEIDAQVSFEELDSRLLKFIEHLEPSGIENPSPIFSTTGATLLGRKKVGRDGAHLKCTFAQGSKVFDAIAFRKGVFAELLPPKLDLAYHFEVNEYRGVRTPQLNVLDFRASDPD